MKSYKEPDFQDRVRRAAEARQKALDALKARPAIDPEVLAQSRRIRDERLATEAQARADRKAGQLALKQAELAETAASPKPAAPTEAERKEARDARYAARKSRR